MQDCLNEFMTSIAAANTENKWRVLTRSNAISPTHHTNGVTLPNVNGFRNVGHYRHYHRFSFLFKWYILHIYTEAYNACMSNINAILRCFRILNGYDPITAYKHLSDQY